MEWWWWWWCSLSRTRRRGREDFCIVVVIGGVSGIFVVRHVEQASKSGLREDRVAFMVNVANCSFFKKMREKEYII